MLHLFFSKSLPFNRGAKVRTFFYFPNFYRKKIYLFLKYFIPYLIILFITIAVWECKGSTFFYPFPNIIFCHLLTLSLICSFSVDSSISAKKCSCFCHVFLVIYDINLTPIFCLKRFWAHLCGEGKWCIQKHWLHLKFLRTPTFPFILPK